MSAFLPFNAKFNIFNVIISLVIVWEKVWRRDFALEKNTPTPTNVTWK